MTAELEISKLCFIALHPRPIRGLSVVKPIFSSSGKDKYEDLRRSALRSLKR
jgi:hypothetical protein